MKSPFLKAIHAGLATLVAVGVTFLVSGELNRAELAIGVTGVITTGLAYFTTNVPGWRFLKALVPALTGSVAALGLYIDSGVFDKGALEILLTSLGLAALIAWTTNTSGAKVQINSYGSEVKTLPVPPEAAERAEKVYVSKDELTGGQEQRQGMPPGMDPDKP